MHNCSDVPKILVGLSLSASVVGVFLVNLQHASYVQEELLISVGNVLSVMLNFW